MGRRRFFYVLGSVALGPLIPNVSLARRGACKPKRGFKLFEYGNEPSPHDLIGKKAPSFHQYDINPSSQTYEKLVGPQDYAGKIVLVNFWASWCGPCLRELPYLDQLQQAHSDVQVLALEADATSHWRELRSELSELTFPILEKKGIMPTSVRLCESEGEFFDYKKGKEDNYTGCIVANFLYGKADGLPATFVIDKQQIVREFKLGEVGGKQELEAIVEKYR